MATGVETRSESRENVATQIIYIGLTAADWKGVFATIRNTRRFIYADRRFFGSVAWLEEQYKSQPTDPHNESHDDSESREARERAGSQPPVGCRIGLG